MCQQALAHPGYTRGTNALALQTSEGCVFVRKYNKNERYNSRVQKLRVSLWQENQKEKRTLEELVAVIEEKYKISIKIEEGPPYIDPQKGKFAKPIRTVYLFIPAEKVA